MWSPGYSYRYFGCNATYCIIQQEVRELWCFLEYKGRADFEASLAEPMSCNIGAFHAAYHTRMGDYQHQMGIRENGSHAIVAGAGPMGLGALDYAIEARLETALLRGTEE
jgi:threonine dehydrogenase-like Zn-dependent dehydrogenase